MALSAGEILQTRYGSVYRSFAHNQQDKTLILLHGNSSSSNFWKPLMESSLQNEFNFLAFDLPGHGNSPIPEDPQLAYSFPAYADLLVEIVGRFELDNYFLFGHSLGGHIILESLDRLSKCKGAMIMGTPPFTMPPKLELAFQMSPQFLSFMQAGTDRMAMEATFKNMFSEDDPSHAELLLKDYFRTDPQARLILTQNIYQGKFVDEVQAIRKTKIPMYVAIAEQDQMVNPAYFSQFLPDLGVLFIPGAGHYAPLEKQEVFVKLILEKFSS